MTTEYPPVIYGGLGTAVGGWVTASARAGMAVGVMLVAGGLVGDDPTAGRYGGLHHATPVDEVERARGGIRFFQRSWADGAAAGVPLARRWRPDIVHLHTAMIWPQAQAIQEQTGRPLVYHVHSVDRAEYEIGHEPLPWLVHSHAQDAAIAHADRLIALSRDERDLLTGYYPQVSDRIRIVGNGIDEAATHGPVRRRATPSKAPVVLYSGRLVERKGIRELLDAIPRVLAAHPDTRFVFAGGPPPLTGVQVADQWLTPELARFRRQIHFTGWLGPAELADWYRAADILVVPSRYEPFGMVVLEGMLHGLPIVSSDVGGPGEILEHERTALLFPPRDVERLAAAITALVRDYALRARIARGAAAEVRRRWTWPNRVAEMRAVYAELLAA